MGIYLDFPIPRPVYDAIAEMTTDQLFETMDLLGCPHDDAPEEEHHKWARERLYRFLYDPAWKK